jgi:hypothetical protein
MMFSGVVGGIVDRSVREVCRGFPLALIGLWWCGRELGRGIQISRTMSRNEVKTPIGDRFQI